MGEALAEAGRPVVAMAQTTGASREVLRDEAGFAKADTVARFSSMTKMQAIGRGGVMLVDEASLLGTREMLRNCSRWPTESGPGWCWWATAGSTEASRPASR